MHVDVNFDGFAYIGPYSIDQPSLYQTQLLNFTVESQMKRKTLQA